MDGDGAEEEGEEERGVGTHLVAEEDQERHRRKAGRSAAGSGDVTGQEEGQACG